jgi:hypothetical protein
MPRLTLRRLAIVVAVGTLLLTAALAVAVLAGGLSLAAATLLELAGLIFGLLGVVVIGIRRLDVKLQRGLRRHREHAERLQAEADRLRDDIAVLFAQVRDAFGEERVEVLTRLAETRVRLGQVSDQVSGLERTVERLPLILPAAQAVAAGAGEPGDRLYAKVEALAELRSLVTPRAPMPALGGWALDADILFLVARTLIDRRPDLVVECGSGASSVWLGYVAQHLGVGRVVALEHDERFLESSRAAVAEHDLADIVEIRYAPLAPWSDPAAADARGAGPRSTGGEEYRWYALDAVTDLDGIGVLLVDGPPAAVGSCSRFPAAPVLFPRCARNAVVVLDDADRPDEKAFSDRWVADWPEFERTTRAGGTAHVFTRRAHD